MRTAFSIANPDEMVATITLTATVGELRKLRSQLTDSWPSWDLSRQIGDVIRQAEARFYANPEPTNE